MDPVNDLIADLVVGHVSPPGQDIRLGQYRFRKTMLWFVERGRIMIPSTELAEFDDLLTVFDALDAERSPPTVEEINEALAPGRKDWTWRGKEK